MLAHGASLAAHCSQGSSFSDGLVRQGWVLHLQPILLLVLFPAVAVGNVGLTSAQQLCTSSRRDPSTALSPGSHRCLGRVEWVLIKQSSPSEGLALAGCARSHSNTHTSIICQVSPAQPGHFRARALSLLRKCRKQCHCHSPLGHFAQSSKTFTNYFHHSQKSQIHSLACVQW